MRFSDLTPNQPEAAPSGWLVLFMSAIGTLRYLWSLVYAGGLALGAYSVARFFELSENAALCLAMGVAIAHGASLVIRTLIEFRLKMESFLERQHEIRSDIAQNSWEMELRERKRDERPSEKDLLMEIANELHSRRSL